MLAGVIWISHAAAVSHAPLHVLLFYFHQSVENEVGNFHHWHNLIVTSLDAAQDYAGQQQVCPLLYLFCGLVLSVFAPHAAALSIRLACG